METLTPAGDTGNTPAISRLEELLTKKNKIKCCHYLLKLYLHVVPNPYAFCVCVQLKNLKDQNDAEKSVPHVHYISRVKFMLSVS